MMNVFVLALLLFVTIAPAVDAGDPPPSGPGADCQTYQLPAGAFVERCGGDYTIGLPQGS